MPSSNGTARSLPELAKQRFAPLSPAETEFFQAVEEGRPASMLSANARENDPAASAKWNGDRLVRAACIAWTCADPQAKRLVHYRGVDLRGAKVEGDLDLSKAKIEFFFSAERCAFLGSILLRYAEAREVHFTRCHVKGPAGDAKEFKALDAEGAKFSGSLCFDDCSNAHGEVSLLGVTLGGDLDCRGSHFSNPKSDALSADGARIEGDVLFGGCKTKGVVRFLGATIKGNLDCSAAQFRTRKGGINGDGMKIGGDVLLSEGFRAQGLVSLSETQIGGNLDCTNSQFSGPNEALRLEGAEIGGNVLFSDFTAKGEVNLQGATINGNLDCQNSDGDQKTRFLNSEDALTVDGLKVTGDVTFGKGFESHGEVRMFGAVIGGDFDCEGAHFIHDEGALSADGAKITGDVRFSGGVEANGQIRFLGTNIGGNLHCQETELSAGDLGNENELAGDLGNESELAGDLGNESEDDLESTFSVEGAKIEGSVYFGHRFVVEGEVSLIGATIAGDLEFGGADFRAAGGSALRADRATIGGDVLFGEGFRAKGELGFLGAIIGGDLDCEDAEFSNSNDDALSAESTKIEGSVTLHKRLKLSGRFNLESAEVHHRLDLRGFSIPRKATINVRSATVGAVHGDEANLRSAGHLDLDGFTYGRLHIDDPEQAASWIEWLQKQPREQFAPQPYEQLAAVLRKMGHERAARRAMIAKNRARARTTSFPNQAWWWYNLFGWAIGYGYAPWRAFMMSIALILSGTVLFHLGDSKGLMSRSKESVSGPGSPAKSAVSPAFEPFFYSLETFTPLLKLDQSANWIPNSNESNLEIQRFSLPFTGNFLHYYLYAHIILGWLLTSLWVGAVTGLVKS